MEKPHVSISGCKPPRADAESHKARLCLCSTETCACGGEAPSTASDVVLASGGRAPAAPGHPPVGPTVVLGPKGYAFQPGCRGYK